MTKTHATFGSLLRTAHHFGDFTISHALSIAKHDRLAQSRRQI